MAMWSLRHTEPTGSLRQVLFFSARGDQMKSSLPFPFLNSSQGAWKKKTGKRGFSFWWAVFLATRQPTLSSEDFFSEVAPDSLVFNPSHLPHSSSLNRVAHMVEQEAPGSLFKPAGTLKLCWEKEESSRISPQNGLEFRGLLPLRAEMSEMIGYREERCKKKKKKQVRKQQQRRGLKHKRI